MNARTVFADPGQRKVLMEKFFALATPANVMSDTAAFLDWLGEERRCAARSHRHHRVLHGRLHVAHRGWDLSGPHCRYRVLLPQPARDRCAGQPPSPGSKNEIPRLCRRSDGGSSFTDEMKQRLERALTEAGVDHTIETYPARHGWVLSDTPAHDPAAAERHWQTLLALIDATLR